MKILIADDHSVVRRGLKQIIVMRPGWTVAGEVSSPDEVLSTLRLQEFDMIILDVSLGARSGIDVLGDIRAEFPRLPVLMLSMHDEEQYAIRCLRAGASGYIQKDGSPEELLEAMQRVAMGRTYVSEAVAEQLATEVARGSSEHHPHERLSAREFEVFRLLGSGKSATEIADALHLSVKTVSTYRKRILMKTGFRSNADIITYAIRSGLM